MTHACVSVGREVEAAPPSDMFVSGVYDRTVRG